MTAKSIAKSSALVILTILVVLIAIFALLESVPAYALDDEYVSAASEYYSIFFPENYTQWDSTGHNVSRPNSTDVADYFRLVLNQGYTDYTKVEYRVADGAYVEATKGTFNSVTCYYVPIMYNQTIYTFRLTDPNTNLTVEDDFTTITVFDFVAPRVIDKSATTRIVKIRDDASDGRDLSVAGLKSVKIYTALQIFYTKNFNNLDKVTSYTCDFSSTSNMGFLGDVYIRIEDIAGNVTEELLWERIETSNYESLKATIEYYLSFETEDGMTLSDSIRSQLNIALHEIAISYGTTGIPTMSTASTHAMELANHYVYEGGSIDDTLTIEVEEGITLPNASAVYYYQDVKYGDELLLKITSTTQENTNSNIPATHAKKYSVEFSVNGKPKPLSNGVSIYCTFSGADQLVGVYTDNTVLDSSQSTTTSVRYTITDNGTYTVYYGTPETPSTPWWVWLIVAVSVAGTIIGTTIVIIALKRKKQSC